MSMPHALRHIDKYGEINLDTTTLRHLRDHAVEANAEDKRVRDQLSPDLQKKEWDPVFAKDTEERNEAVRRIDAELKRRKSTSAPESAPAKAPARPREC
jgi:hypothetical protein